MGLLRWFTKNWANTAEPTHADLKPLVLPLVPEAAISRICSIVAKLPMWKVETSPPDGPLHLTRRTRIVGYTDDIRLQFLPEGRGTIIHAESRSRVGVGDLGQNRRNILELWEAIAQHS